MITRGNLKEVDKAYLAGFLDGEGSISICRSKPNNHWRYRTYRYTLEVTVTNTNKKIIELLANLFEGSWMRIRHHNNPVWKDAYCIRWASVKAKNLLEMLLPYLIIKKKQAELAVEFQNRKTQKRGFIPVKAGKGLSHRLSDKEIQKRHYYYDSIIRLNNRERVVKTLRPAETKRSSP